VLTFRVKHFPGEPQLIESEYVRYLIFLQIRNYLLKGDLQLSLADETRLTAYAVQAYLGDYDAELHKEGYLDELKFLSRKSLKAEETIIQLHKELRYWTTYSYLSPIFVLEIEFLNLNPEVKHQPKWSWHF
jgi:hypothetical protein